MTSWRENRALLTWLPTTMLLLAGGVAFAAFPALEGPAFPSGDVGLTGESIGNQEDADIAAGGSGYLVVWTDMRTSYDNYQGLEQTGSDVYAARLDASGNLIDTTPIVVSQDVGTQEKPEVAWNGQNWLVVWENETSTGTGGAAEMRVFGARVAADGTVLDDQAFEVLDPPFDAGGIIEMEVAANGSDWLVVGEGDSGGGLLGVRVAGDGTILDTEPVALAGGPYEGIFFVQLEVAQGEYFLVGDGDYGFQARRFAPDLRPLGAPISLPGPATRFSSNGTDYFVVWNPDGGILRGSRMTPTGTLLDTGGIPIMESDYWGGDDSRVAWDGSTWWVFHWLPYPEGGVHSVRVAADGTLVDSTPFPVIPPEINDFVGIYGIRVAGDNAGGVQLVWADMECGGCANESYAEPPWDIRGEHISADTQISPVQAVSCSAPAQTNPDLTPGPDGFLALYVSEVDEVQRIMARRLDPLGNPLDEQPIEIASGFYVTNPEAAWNGSVYMITWDEFYYCVGGDWPPCGEFIHAKRMLPDGTILDEEPIVVMPAWEGDVAALGDNFLVVGRYYPGSAGYVFPFAMRVDGSTGELLDPEPRLVGGNFAVRPRVTSFAGKWLVVWEQMASHDESWGWSRYNFVSADGAITYEPIVGTPVACGGGAPEVAASAESALVVCRESYWGHFLSDVNGGLIFPDETSTGSGFPISSEVQEQRAPTVAFDGSDFIVVWEDKRHAVDYIDERSDLYGTRVSVGGAVLDPAGNPIATDVAPEQQPALASAGGNTLLAASIFKDDPGLTAYRMGIFHGSGTFTDPPEARFQGTPTEGCSPLAVDFTDQSLGNVSSWLWQFGDGTTSTEQHPNHVFAIPGVYSVTMTATNSLGGLDTAARFDYVTSALPTQAAFTANPTQVCAPLGEVTFTDLSDGFPDSWIWDFGDGDYSMEQHPTHTYLWPGTYTVSLTVSGSCGTDSTTVVDVIQVDPPCDQLSLALSDIPVVGVIISGDYTSTHAYDIDDFELFYEDILNDGGGSYSMLDHRWDFEVPAADVVTFHANTHASETEGSDWFRFEYSTDGVNFTPLADVPVGYGTITAPMPSSVNGTVIVRLVDTDQTTLNYLHHVSVDFMSINAFVPLPPLECSAVVGLTFDDAATLSWSPSLETTHYDIMRGSIGNLNINASVGDADCAQPLHAATTWSDPEVPPSGSGFYYVIRGQAENRSPGTFDNPGPPPLGFEQRDDEIGTGGGVSCPGP